MSDKIELFKLIAIAVVSGLIGVGVIFYGDQVFMRNQKRDNTNS